MSDNSPDTPKSTDSSSDTDIASVTVSNWNDIAAHIEKATQYSERVAQTYVLTSLGATRQEISTILGITPSTVDNNTQKLQNESTTNPITEADYSESRPDYNPVFWTNDFTDILTQPPHFTDTSNTTGTTSLTDQSPIKYIIAYSPALTDPVISPETTRYIEYNPDTGETVFVARIRDHLSNAPSANNPSGIEPAHETSSTTRHTVYENVGKFIVQHLEDALNVEWAFDRVTDAPFYSPDFDAVLREYIKYNEEKHNHIEETTDNELDEPTAPVDLSTASIKQIMQVSHRASPDTLADLLDLTRDDAENLHTRARYFFEEWDDDLFNSPSANAELYAILQDVDSSGEWIAYCEAEQELIQNAAERVQAMMTDK